MTGNSEQSGRPLVDGDEQHVGARAGFRVWHLPKSLLRGDLGWKIILIYLYIEITVCNILSRASGRETTMDHRQLLSFLTLAEELHFVRAAERLHITQSAVSQQIANLEKQLNVRLFDRTKRKVMLSVAGQIFLEEARKGIRQLETAAAMAKRAAKGQTGRISIAYVDAAPFNILSPLVLAFRQACPEVHLDLHEMMSSEQFPALLAGQIDIGLTRPMMNDPAIRSTLLQREPYVVVMPVGHALANSDSIDMADLRHEPFIGTSAEKAKYIEERFRDLSRRLGFTRRIVQEV